MSALSAPRDSLVTMKGPTSKGKGRGRERREERKEKGERREEGEERERERKVGLASVQKIFWLWPWHIFTVEDIV